MPLRPCHVPGWVQSSGVRGAKALLWSTGLVLAPFHVVAARVPSAQELIDEFRDSQLILGDRHAAVTNSLRAVLEGSREASEMESDLQRFVEAVDEHTASFGGLELVMHAPLSDLKAGYIRFLQWRRAEVPRTVREVLLAGSSAERKPAWRTVMEEVLLPVAREEERWLQELAELERVAMAAPVAGAVEARRRTLLERYGKWLVLFSGSTLVVALLLWFLLRKGRPGKIPG